jgi:hypothetical protein
LAEPDPVAALAAQLEELREEVRQERGQLARTQGELGAVRARLEAETSQTMMLRLEIKRQGGQLEEAIEKRRLKPPPAPWWAVGQEQGTAMLAELRAWADGFLARHYPGYAARLAGCWWRHMEAVWELSTLRAEWERIYADEENRDLAGALAWHDKYLPGVLSRLAETIKCTPGSCQYDRRR